MGGATNRISYRHAVRFLGLSAALLVLLFTAAPAAVAAGHVESRFGPVAGFPFGEPRNLSLGYPTLLIDVAPGSEDSDVYSWTIDPTDLSASLLWADYWVVPGDLEGGILVFPRDGGVWARDVAHGDVEFPISLRSAGTKSKSAPQISGTTVVWQESNAGQRDIRGATFDPVTHAVTRTFWVAHRATNEKDPRIAGDWVVWMDGRAGNWDIYGRDLATGTVKAICTNHAKQDQAWTDGTWVVWRDWRNESSAGADIYGRRLTATSHVRAICRARRMQEEPRVAGGFAVWTDWRHDPHYGPGLHDTDVYGWDAVSRSVFLVAGGPLMEHGAETANGVVMYLRHTEEFRDMPAEGSVLGASLAH